MKKIVLIAVATLGMSSAAAQAAAFPRLAALASPASLPSLAAPSASRPLAGFYPLVNRQFVSNIGRVGSSVVTGPLNLPGLGTLTLGRLLP